MKRGFFLKIALAIVGGFGLLLAGFYFYEPVWFKIQEQRLLSDDPATRDSAANSIVAERRKASPYIRKWLASDDDRLFIASCKIIENMSDGQWEEFLPEINTILSEISTNRAMTAAELVLKTAFIEHREWRELIKNPNARLGMLAHEILYGYFQDQCRAFDELENCTDARMLAPLVKALKNESNPAFCQDLIYNIGRIGGERAIPPLLWALEHNAPERHMGYVVYECLAEFGDSRMVDPLIEILFRSPNPGVRWNVINTLGDVGDSRCLDALVKVFDTDCDSEVRAAAGYAFGNIMDNNAVDILIKALEKDSDPEVRNGAAYSLGDLANSKALFPLIKALETDCFSDVRWRASYSLGEIGDARAVEPLISSLASDPDRATRCGAAFSLGTLGDRRAIQPLIAAATNDNDPEVQDSAIWALRSFECESVEEALKSAKTRGKVAATIALIYLHGGALDEYSYKIIEHSIRMSDFEYAATRWGDIKSIEGVIDGLISWPRPNRKLFSDFISRMPESCPAFDLAATWGTRKKQAKSIKEWFKKNESRLAWDAEKRKYYLK